MTSFRQVHRVATVALALAAITLPTTGAALATEGSNFREAERGQYGVIATESVAATEVGMAILDAGGNAADAAIAIVFAISVARPQSCGIGGGGFMVYRGADGEVAALDFREEAPSAFTATTLSTPGLHSGFTGHLTVGVPGVVAALDKVLTRFGSMAWADLIAPSIELATNGVEVTESLSSQMAVAAGRLRLFPPSAEQFLIGGVTPYPPGSTLVQPVLAETLTRLAVDGPDDFYTGTTAELLVADMEKNGANYAEFGEQGLMTMQDLADYEAIWREPLVGTYRGREIIAMPPPTSGGVALIEMLNILEGFDLAAAGQSSADYFHLIAEAQKIAWADRGRYLGDPDVVDVPVAELTSKAYAALRRSEIDLNAAGTYQPGDVGRPALAAKAEGEDYNPLGSTTHLVVIDAAGNTVSLTCTIESSFGSAVVAEGLGFLLNNELTDFSGAGTANEPGPGKRPRSSINPAIVVTDGKPTLAVGGAGGATIIMGSVLAAINHIDYGLDVARATDAERLDDPSGTMSIESVRVGPDILAELQNRGHRLQSTGEYHILPRVQSAGIDLATGDRLAASDPRTDWAAAAQTTAPPSSPQPNPDPVAQPDATPTLPTTGGGLPLVLTTAMMMVGLRLQKRRETA